MTEITDTAAFDTQDRSPGVRVQTSDESLSTAERLIPAAAALFRQKGYHQAHTRELAQELGIQSASLYYYINNKEDLLYRICIDGLQEIHKAVQAAIDKTDDSPNRIVAAIHAHIGTALPNTDVHSTMLLELRSLSEGRRGIVLAKRHEYESLLRSVIEEAQANGLLRTDMPAKFLTLALLNLLNWTIFWFRPDGALSANDVANLLTTIFLDGVSAGRPESAR